MVSKHDGRKEEILRTLEKNRWHRTLASEELGISPPALSELIQKWWPEQLHPSGKGRGGIGRLPDPNYRVQGELDPEFVRGVLEKYGWNVRTARRSLRVSRMWLEAFVAAHWPERKEKHDVE